MGPNDEWYEWLDAFRWAIVVAFAVAAIGYVAWTAAAGWHFAVSVGAGVVLALFALDCAVYSVAHASRRVIRIAAMVVLAFSIPLLALTDFTGTGALGAAGALTFLACDFAVQRDQRGIHLNNP